LLWQKLQNERKSLQKKEKKDKTLLTKQQKKEHLTITDNVYYTDTEA
jgi:hypothetical protein